MLTKEGFTQWLKENEYNIVAPRAFTTLSCPVASYLRTLTGRRVSVGAESWIDNGIEHPLPIWAKKLVRLYDLELIMDEDPVQGIHVLFLMT